MIRIPRRRQRDEEDPLDNLEVVPLPSQRRRAILIVAVLALGGLTAALATGGLQEVLDGLSAAGSIAYKSASEVLPAGFNSATPHPAEQVPQAAVAAAADAHATATAAVPLVAAAPVAATTAAAVVVPLAAAAPVTAVVPLKTRVAFEVSDGKNGRLEIMDEPAPPQCHARPNMDFAGDAVTWGLGHKANSAAECCRRCQAYRQGPGRPQPCNMWTWCGDPSGICWTMDIHNHTTGDCWLKWQKKWDNITDYSRTNLEINHQGPFSAAFRKEHKTAPELVPWISGLVPPM